MEKNRHHLFFEKARYGRRNRQGNKLRRIFVYEIPVQLHNKIHQEIEFVPIPPEGEMSEMLRQYNILKPFIDRLSPAEACRWLADLSDYRPFIDVMKQQEKILRDG